MCLLCTTLRFRFHFHFHLEIRTCRIIVHAISPGLGLSISLTRCCFRLTWLDDSPSLPDFCQVNLSPFDSLYLSLLLALDIFRHPGLIRRPSLVIILTRHYSIPGGGIVFYLEFYRTISGLPIERTAWNASQLLALALMKEDATTIQSHARDCF